MLPNSVETRVYQGYIECKNKQESKQQTNKKQATTVQYLHSMVKKFQFLLKLLSQKNIYILFFLFTF